MALVILREKVASAVSTPSVVCVKPNFTEDSLSSGPRKTGTAMAVGAISSMSGLSVMTRVMLRKSPPSSTLA